MSTPKEQYEDMLDELDPQTKERMLNHVPFARILEEVDPIAFRCGLNDFQATCDECGESFWADDADAEAVCAVCVAEAKQEEADEDRANEEEGK